MMKNERRVIDLLIKYNIDPAIVSLYADAIELQYRLKPSKIFDILWCDVFKYKKYSNIIVSLYKAPPRYGWQIVFIDLTAENIIDIERRIEESERNQINKKRLRRINKLIK